MPKVIKIPREPNPSCKLPDDLDTPVWRYMDIDKFYSILDVNALYLCRADLLQDRFEGTYSRRQILMDEGWFRKINESHMIESEKERRRKDRLKTFISCWSMGHCDLDLMWKGYIRNPPGVAIRSSVRRLKDICDKAADYWPLDISIVTYFDHAGGKRINYYGTPSTFFYKDNHFRLDNEFRIIHYPNISGPPPTHIFFKMDLKDLIENVVFQPRVNESSFKSVMEALKKARLDTIPILASRDDRDLIE